jgi:hypothetical protein
MGLSIYNISKDDDYHTQRNNKIIPLSACNVTSAIMMLKASGIDFDYPKDKQPEDYLMEMLLSDEGYEVTKKIAPWAIENNIRPNELHAVLNHFINKLVGRKVTYFTLHRSMKSIIFDIIKGKASLVSGSFTEYGHMITIVGFTTNQIINSGNLKSKDEIDMNKVINIIVDDPYGNYFKNYEDQRGNNIYFPLNEIDGLLKSYNNLDSKWCHVIF